MRDVVLWDSCLIIDAIAKEPEKYKHLLPMLQKAEKKELVIVVSTVSIAEVRYCKELNARGVSQDQQAELIEAWMNSDYVARRNAHSGICRLEAEIGRDVGKDNKNLTPIDSIILATAIQHNVSALLTYDDGRSNTVGLLELDGKYGDPKLRILHPRDYVKQLEMELR